MKYSFLYVASIVLVNIAFTHIDPVKLPDGSLWSFGSVLVGFIFIFRDFAQLEVGNKSIIPLMLVAAGISYIMADPVVLVASVMSFIFSEFVDFSIFSFYKSSVAKRVLCSGIFSAPIDTFLFLYIIDEISIYSFIAMTISKFLALLVVFYIHKNGLRAQ